MPGGAAGFLAEAGGGRAPGPAFDLSMRAGCFGGVQQHNRPWTPAGVSLGGQCKLVGILVAAIVATVSIALLCH